MIYHSSLDSAKSICSWEFIALNACVSKEEQLKMISLHPTNLGKQKQIKPKAEIK